jgi:hypothetical protein
MAPPALDRVIQACLAKDPDDRWQTAHDVLLQLRWIEEGGSVAGVPAPVAARRRSRERLAWGLFGVAALASVALAAGFAARTPEPARPVRFQMIPDPEIASVGSPRISPDGQHVVFNGTDSTGKTMLWLRSLDALEARPLSGTEGAGRPFWSPDSRYLAFFSGGKLKKIAAAGAPPQTICDAPNGADGTWGSRDVILYDGQATDPIRSVPASGGIPKPILAADAEKNESAVGWPEFLPDGRHFLYMSMQTGENYLAVGSTEPGFEPIQLFATSSRVAYAPPGHLLYVREGTLVAQAFDPGGRKLRGEPVPLAEEIGTSGVGLAHFSASANGTLIYRAGETGVRRLVWLDATGKEVEEIGEPAEYATTALSPRGDRLALEIRDPRSGNGDLWIRDLERKVNSRFTFDPANDSGPLWSPDGDSIVFSSDRGEDLGLYRKAASGVGEVGVQPAFWRRNRLGPVDLAPRRRTGGRRAVPVHRGTLPRGAAGLFARRRLDRLRLAGVRSHGGLRTAVSRTGRQVADLDQRRERVLVERRWFEAVLPGHRPQADARRRRDGRVADRRPAGAAVRLPRPSDHPAQPLLGCGRGATLPVPQVPASRRRLPHDRRAQLATNAAALRLGRLERQGGATSRKNGPAQHTADRSQLRRRVHLRARGRQKVRVQAVSGVHLPDGARGPTGV